MYRDPFGQEHRYAPPAGWTPPASERFSVDEEWEKICARGLSFEPFDGPTQLHGVRGECLNPLITDQHLLRIRAVAPDEPLQNGRLYSILWTNEDEAQAYRDKIGVTNKAPIMITKFLYFTGFEWWCLCKDSMTKLGSAIVVGEVVGVLSAAAVLAGCGPGAPVHARQAACGNPFDAASSECSGIGANAATETHFVVDDTTQSIGFAGSILYGSPSVQVPFVPSPQLTFTPTVSGTVILTAMVSIFLTNTSGTVVPSAYLLGAIQDTTAGSQLDFFPKSGPVHSYNNVGGGTASVTQSVTQQVSIHDEVAVIAGHSYNFYLAVQTSGITVTAHVTSAQLQVESIKR
jgi:hypothetical protein